MSDEDDLSFEELFDGGKTGRGSVRSSAEAGPPTASAFDLAALFDAVVHGTGTVPAELAQRFEVVALPGHPVAGHLRSDDLVLRRGLGEGRLTQLTAVDDPRIAGWLTGPDGRLAPDRLVLRHAATTADDVYEDDLAQEDQVALERIRQQLVDRPATSLLSRTGEQGGRASTIAVVVRSSDSTIFAVESATVELLFDQDPVHRVGRDVGVKVMLTKRATVRVRAVPTDATEFTAGEMVQTVTLEPGGHQDVQLTFTPKPPRRLFARIMFYDTVDPQTRGARPFPADVPIELVFDGQAQGIKRTRLLADGTFLDPDDGQPGIRMLHRWRSAKLRSPAANRRHRLAWTTNSDRGSPTTLLEEEQVPADNQSVLHLLPRDGWIPATRFWTVPQAHRRPDGSVRKDLDISASPDSLGSVQQPLTYILERTHGSLINGKRIDHVVVLMLENRGFDHFMGWLYDRQQPPPHRWPAQAPPSQQGLRAFEGLDGLDNLGNPYSYVDESGLRHQGTLSPRKGARASNMPRTNPHEDFIHIFQQMYGKDVPFDSMRTAEGRNRLVKQNGRYRVPPMNGFVQNFANAIEHHRGVTTFTDDVLSEIMDMYTPEQLPVLSGLARNFAVSDLWFCSVPSQTNTNRAFWAAGTAVGLVTNNHYDAYANSWDPRMIAFRKAAHGSHADRLPEGTRSMFDVLEDDEISWKYYWEIEWPSKAVGGGQYFRTMFSQFAPEAFDAHFPKTSDFLDDARRGTLPAVTYIEPTWGGGPQWNMKLRGVGNEFHPVEDVMVGEDYVKSIYDALANGANWDRTLLVITFDENGGTYDHFPPWAARPSGREPQDPQFGFTFDLYGVRVPTLVIGRHIRPGTVFRSPTDTPFDHTSIIATILEWQGMNPAAVQLGNRVAHAPTFGGLLEIDGQDDDPRRHTATGLGAPRRAQNSQVIRYGDPVLLRYVGSLWPRNERDDGVSYLGTPEWWIRYQTHYPTVTNRAGALPFRILRPNGHANVEAGVAVRLQVAAGAQAGLTLAVPASYGADTVYLYKGSNPSEWIIWPVADRVEGAELHYDDEVLILSERYLPRRVNTMVTDPFQKLTVEPQPAPKATKRYAKYRPGEWDVWRLERP